MIRNAHLLRLQADPLRVLTRPGTPVQHQYPRPDQFSQCRPLGKASYIIVHTDQSHVPAYDRFDQCSPLSCDNAVQRCSAEPSVTPDSLARQLHAVDWLSVLSAYSVMLPACEQVGELATTACVALDRAVAMRDANAAQRAHQELLGSLTSGADQWNRVDWAPQPLRVAAIAQLFLQYDVTGVMLHTTQGRQVRGAEFALNFIAKERVRLASVIALQGDAADPTRFGQYCGMTELMSRVVHNYRVDTSSDLLELIAQGDIATLQQRVEGRDPDRALALYQAMMNARAFQHAARIGSALHYANPQHDPEYALGQLAVVLSVVTSYLEQSTPAVSERATDRASEDALRFVVGNIADAQARMAEDMHAGRPVYWGAYVNFEAVRPLWNAIDRIYNDTESPLFAAAGATIELFANPDPAAFRSLG